MLQLDEYDELIAEELKREAEAERRRRAQAMRHPDPRDPDPRDPDPRDPEWPDHADTLEEPHAQV